MQQNKPTPVLHTTNSSRPIDLCSERATVVAEMLLYCRAVDEEKKRTGKQGNPLQNLMGSEAHELDNSLFHVHVDADCLSEELDENLAKAGFTKSDFLTHSGGEPSPRYIRTLKSNDPRSYKNVLSRVTAICKNDSVFNGFVEGEVIVNRKNIPFKEYNPQIPIPFKIQAKREPGGESKTADMHITLCPLGSHRQLLENLLEIGFSLVLAPKPNGLMAVFSLQGAKELIGQLFKSTCNYLHVAGGAAQCTLKDERISHLWVSGSDAPATRVITSPTEST